MWITKALGGTGRYKWYSEDEKVATVEQQDVHQLDKGFILGNLLGETTIHVEDFRNSLNKASIRVLVTEVGSLDWLEDKIELEAHGDFSSLNLFAYDVEGHKYTNQV